MGKYLDPEYKAKHAKLPRSRWTQQKAHAKARGVAFELTFEEWWGLWEASGKWDQRGKLQGQYAMARHGDTGPYALGNVAIVEVYSNLKEQMVNGAHVTHKLTADAVTQVFGLEHSFTQKQIGGIVGVSQGHVSKLLSEKRGKLL